MHIIAHGRKEKEHWKMISMICFNVAWYGNSDSKKLSKSIKTMYPDLWDDEEADEHDDLIEAARARRQNDKVNGR
jgi:type VI protein secretion system component VasA